MYSSNLLIDVWYFLFVSIFQGYINPGLPSAHETQNGKHLLHEQG